MELADVLGGGEADELDYFSILEDGVEAIAGDVVDVAVGFDFQILKFTQLENLIGEKEGPASVDDETGIDA